MEQCSEDILERRLAAVLSGVLEDDDLWAALAAESRGQADREGLAREAVRVYRATATVLTSRADVESPGPIDRALGVLQETADAWALASVDWTSAELAEMYIPSRALIEMTVRLDEMDEWSAVLGFPLKLQEARDQMPDVPWPAEDDPPALTGSDIADRFCGVLRSYDEIRDMRQLRSGRAMLGSPEFRRAACQELSSSRGWVVWSRSHLEARAQPVAIAMVQVARAFFVASCVTDADEMLFACNAFIRKLLHRTGALDWLADEGAELPSWVGESN